MMGLVSITHLLSASIPNSSSPPSPSTSSSSPPSFSTSSTRSTKRISKLRLPKDVKGLEDLEGMTLGGMSSLPYCGSTLEEEERPGSSLSTASRSSRIPVLTRSHSLRVKSSSSSSSTSHGQDGAKGSSKVSGKGRSDARPGSRASPSVGKGLVRSASFVSSRGMKGLPSPPSPSSAHSSHRHPAHSLTPDTPRRAPAHSSTHAKRPATSGPDRKSHSYAGMMGSPWNHHHNYHYHNNSHHHNNHHQYHHQYHHHLSYSHHGKRPNFLPVSTATSSSSQFSSLPTTPASQPDTPSRSPDSNEVDDADSVKSFGSVSSAVSCDAALTHHNRHQGQGAACSGGSSRGVRSLKYVLHCRHNHEHDPDQYLTPTQRAARRIRELKAQLSEARREVQQRDTEIARLTRELVELRLLKARGPQWEEDEEEEDGARGGSGSSGGRGGKIADKGEGVSATPAASTHTLATPKTTASGTPSEGSEPELRRLMENMNAGAPDPAAPQHPPSASPAGGSVAETTADSVDLTRSSLADSGHYDDLTSPSLSSRDPFESNRGSVRGPRTEEESVEVEIEECEHEEDEIAAANEASARSSSREGGGEAVDPWVAVEVAEERLREEYLRREEMLKRNHLEEYHELKEKHNDRVEALLSKLSDANLKYFELRPLYDQSQERVRELDREVMRLKDELAEAELRHQKMYLQMFLKGQQAARIQAEDDLDGGEEGLPSSSGPMMELMRQLSRTEEELEKVKALYHREVNCRNNNNNNNNGTSSRRNGELDPEVTLQFLKSAIYYFFTDRDNAKGHLRAIESILGYSDSERYNIGKVIK